MSHLLLILVLIPLFGAIFSLMIPGRRENAMSSLAFGTAAAQFVFHLGYMISWAASGFHEVNVKEITFYKTFAYQFFLDFYYDEVTAVFLFLGSMLTFLITWYSRYYLHREPGYKRFFNTILLFYFGYTLTVISGNMETLFIGWEILGVSSFLLIAFYRQRYLPVKNAMKIFTIYRIGDLGILLAMWMTHHLFESNFTFSQLNETKEWVHHLQEHSIIGVMVGILVVITASAKSAQLPFTSWLPRAMEGPTPSSAIFYGSLSVHMGAFLLLRTQALWLEQWSVIALIIIVGLTTFFIASRISRVQSSVKAQIAYASVAQIGLIFIEIALGFRQLALIHIGGNAFLRTYQLLVSPSVAAYLIRDMFFHFQPQVQISRVLPSRLSDALYVLSLKEWNLDSLMYRSWWNPLKKLGRKMSFLNMKYLFAFFIPLFAGGFLVLLNQYRVPEWLLLVLPYLFALIGLVSVLKSFVERTNPELAWILVAMNHFCIAIGISFNEHFTFEHVVLYLSGIFPSLFIGLLLMSWLRKRNSALSMGAFQGMSTLYPFVGLGFLICALGMTGFPVSPTFIGEDLIYSHIRSAQFILAALVSISYVLDGISVIRIYARLFLGDPGRMGKDPLARSS